MRFSKTGEDKYCIESYTAFNTFILSTFRFLGTKFQAIIILNSGLGGQNQSNFVLNVKDVTNSIFGLIYLQQFTMTTIYPLTGSLDAGLGLN